MVLVAAVAGRPATASIGQRRSAATAAEEPGQGCTTTNAQPAEGNVYASKSELLEWVNGLLQLQLSTWGAFASGAVFCQLLDAYFSDAIPMHKVNYHASNEYEAVPNYKVLQQGFTALQLTREIHVSKLARGSRTELLELLQYLYKYLLKLKAQEGYNARERRALAVRGGHSPGIDAVPLSTWMSGSQAAGRGGGMNRSSGNWGALAAADTQQGHHTLRPTSSFSPPVKGRVSTTNSTAAATTAVAAAAAPAANSPPYKASDSATPAAAAAAASLTKRPTAPSRIPSASPNRGPTAPAAPMAGEASKQGLLEEAGAEDDVEVGVAVFHVLSCREEELMQSACAAEAEPGLITRLVIPDDAISSSMSRPMSPGSRSQLEVCLGAAEQALHALNHTCINMAQITSSLPACSDSHAFRGKIRSLLDAAESTAAHTQLLLTDAVAVCARKSDGSANDLQRQVAQLQEELSAVRVQLNSSITQLQAALEARPLASQSTLNMALTQLQKQLASTAALDSTLKTVGTAYAALLGLMRKEGAAVARQFLQDSSSSSGCSAQGPQAGALPAVTSKVLKLGDCAMKRLRNGDIYKGCYQGLRKNGEGSYCFLNSDVYEGQFKDDRMAGSGVYSFAPEGRYEGEWINAVYEGHGAETFAKGSTYHGQYSAGLRHGWGVCRFSNADYYEGQWSQGTRNGCGMQQCTDDSNYVGQYRHGKRHGYGVYSFPNGDQFLGEYEEDIPQGYGVYVFGSGQRYEGHWEKGKKHGWSIYTVETGQRWAGSWAEGKPQWVHPVQQLVGAVFQAAGLGLSQQQQQAGLEAVAATPEVADNLSHAAAACRNAQEACALAAAKLDAHWARGGAVQQGVAAAVQGARQAADGAQKTRRKAQLIAARLDAAAVIIESGSRSAHMRVV